MVTCHKCGVKNRDDAEFCKDCGAPLRGVGRRERVSRKECFGLPYGGIIFGIFIGVMIIIWGLQELLGWRIELGTYAIIVVGLLILAGAIYGLTRRRS